VGFSKLDFEQPNLARAAGIGSGVWVALSSLLAMFVGGLVTARSGGYLGRGNAALHGVVLWGATGLVGTMLLSSIVGSMASGLTQAGSDAASMALEHAEVDTAALLTPINAKLAQAGKPQITSEQLAAIGKDAFRIAALQGRFDRQVFVSAITDSTQLNEGDVNEIFAGTIHQADVRLRAVRAQATTAAESAALATGRAFWGVFALLITSLVGAVIGASTGVSRHQREVAVATQFPVDNPTERQAVY